MQAYTCTASSALAAWLLLVCVCRSALHSTKRVPAALQEEIIPTLRELGIGIVAYSPLGRGFLTGTITSPDDFECALSSAPTVHISTIKQLPLRVGMFEVSWI